MDRFIDQDGEGREDIPVKSAIELFKLAHMIVDAL